MSIRRRITLVSATAVAVTVLLVSIGAFLAARQQILEPIDESLLRRAELVENIPGDFVRNPRALSGLTNALFRPLRGDFDAVYYQLIFPDGSVLNVGEDQLVLPLPSDGDVASDEPTLRSEWVDDVHLRIVTVVQEESGIVVQMGRPLTEADQALSDLAIMLAAGSLLGIALAAGLGMLVSRNAVRPIEDLRDEVRQVADTQALASRVEVSDTDDEVAELGRAFNDLLEQLESSRDQQVRLVRDAGHELRTPLTALRMNLEVLRRHEVEGDEREAMLTAANEEVEELSNLVSEIVDLATDRYEEEPKTDVDLGEVAASVAERAHRRNGRPVEVDSDGSVVHGRRDALERAVANIVANADKWAPDGTPIVVSVDTGSVTVADEGPGIPEADLDHIFERFYRGDAARTTPGSGLGLSIVDAIVDDHGGETFARNTDEGAEVGFRLPTA